jgi:uncharacterized membrane protein YciS (DUF1049 family)
MRYTNYILNGRPLQPENFISEGRFRVVTIVVVIVPSLMGVVFISGMIPVCLMIDGGRYLKLRHYQRLKAQRKERYYKSVMASLGHSENEWRLLAA